MLIERKDAGSGNELLMYWKEEGRTPIPVTKDKREFYWNKEIKRLKTALDYEVAKRESIALELEAEIKKTDAMLKCADALIDRARA